MATLSEAFLSLLKRIHPSGGEMQAADRHFATIKARLETVFTVKKLFTAGN